MNVAGELSHVASPASVRTDESRRKFLNCVGAVAGPMFVISMFATALCLLHGELRHYHLSDFVRSLAEIPAGRLWLAAGLTLLNYLILIGYDWLGIRYVGRPMSFPRIALASFLGSAVGNNFGMLLGGSAIRARLYTAWGFSAVEIVRLVLMLSVTFWIGLFALSCAVFIFDPMTIPASLHLPVTSTVPLGVILGCLAVGYLALCAVRREPVRIRQWEFSPPKVWMSLMQFAVATLDLMVAAGVLYVLLPASVPVSYSQLLAIYLLALVASLFSQVPGGLGVLELVVLVLVSPVRPQSVVGSLMAYRAIYYLIPLALGLILLGAYELTLNRRRVGRAVALMGSWTRFAAPRVLTVGVFLAGGMLLLSGATPAAHGRLRLLRDVLPLPVIEVSHLLGSIAGILLILLARSLQRRIETAYYAVCLLLAGGAVVSLLKGFDYEEATVLFVMLLLILPCRRHFYRRGALLTDRFSPGWYAAVVLVLGCTLWLMHFAYKHIEYSGDLWWQFESQGSAPRSLRATAGAVLVTLVFAASRLLRSKPRPPELPNDEELDTACRIVADCSRTSASLALLGDKYFLFNARHSAFIMYGTEGRSWVAMGDPVGDESDAAELIWDFRERCDEGRRWPVFYQVDEDRLSMYVEAGLSLVKIGEEARVPLSGFSLEGSSRKGLRRTNRQVSAEGCTFEVVQPPIEDELLAVLKTISDAWLDERSTAEKGFSLGYFQPEYIRRCPIALVRKGDRPIAFANVWRGAERTELSIDLMRFLPQSPDSVMEFLFVQLMLWGTEQDYQWFNLGMAPLSGVDARRLGPMWNRIAALTFRHGEHFYNFQGLRRYKEKFDPVWSPKYLASPGGFALPVILTNVATLISGGLVKLAAK
ncbi:MAG: bifunctional lysylphosphatidylglycerol flippase/synthetase MprF [Planctomycetaceae bacterium]